VAALELTPVLLAPRCLFTFKEALACKFSLSTVSDERDNIVRTTGEYLQPADRRVEMRS